MQAALDQFESQLLWKKTIIGRPVSKSNKQTLWIHWDKIKMADQWEKLLSVRSPQQLIDLLKPCVKVIQVKSNEAKKYEKDFFYQIVPRPKEPITEDVKLVCRIWYARRQSDLDESLIMDCLQNCGIISNDNKIRIKEIYGNVDPSNPRAEIELWSLGIF